MSYIANRMGSTSIVGAYSLGRIVVSGWGGNAFLVRRSSDNATLAVGFTGSGVVNTAALLSFCAGTNGFLQRIYDQSGHGYDLVQTVFTPTNYQPQIVISGALLNPINGFPTATGGEMAAPVTMDTSGNIGAVVISHLISNVNTFQRLVSFVANGQTTDYANIPSASLITSLNTTSPTLFTQRNSNVANQTTTITAGQTFATGAYITGSTSIISLNGSNVVTSSLSTGNFGAPGAIFTLHWDGWSGEQWNGCTSEVMFFSTSTFADILYAQQSMLYYYGLSNFNPDSQPTILTSIAPPFFMGDQFLKPPNYLTTQFAFSSTSTRVANVVRESLRDGRGTVNTAVIVREVLRSALPTADAITQSLGPPFRPPFKPNFGEITVSYPSGHLHNSFMAITLIVT